MPVRMVMQRADVARIRLARSPAWELVAAVRALADPSRHPGLDPWLRRHRAALDGPGGAVLRALVPPTGFVPDFLTPPPVVARPALDDELRRVAATEPARVAAELRTVHPAGVPDVLAPLLGPDVPRALDDLVGAMRGFWAAAIAPVWPQVAAVLETDLLHRARTLAEHGAEGLVAGLHPAVAWEDGEVLVGVPYDARVDVAGRGLLLLPSLFVWPDVMAVVDEPWQPTVIYPARGIGDVWTGRPPAPSEALAALLGRSRAALLVDLDAFRTTTALALRHGPGGSTVSHHLRVLVDAGLVSRHRTGTSVHYRRTELGRLLVGGAGVSARAPG